MIETIKRHIALILLLFLGCTAAAAQEIDWENIDYTGSSIDNPRRLTVPPGRYELSDSVNTFLWSLHKFRPEVVHYELTVEDYAMGYITTFGSELRHTEIEVLWLNERGDSLSLPLDTLGADYITHMIDVDAWDNYSCAETQRGVFLHLMPGRYLVKSHGVYTIEEGTSNGPLLTTFLLWHPGAPPEVLPVPRRLLRGTRENPEFIGSMTADSPVQACRIKQISDNYIKIRDNFDGRVYYSFMLKDTLDVTLNTTEFGSRLSLESMLGRYLTEDDSLLYIPGGSSVRYRLPPDRYLLSVRDTAETVSPCEIGFLIETAPPPPPPEWTKLMYYSPDVAGHNYVRSYTMLDAAGADAAVTVTHYDGLGRESQTVMTDGSPEGGDMVTHTDYDLVGRPWRQWLPGIGANAGGYTRQGAIDYTRAYGSEPMPYSLTEYEPSSLNRVRTQYGAGYQAYKAGAGVVNSYDLNTAKTGERCCFLYSVTATPDNPGGAVTVRCHGEYPESQLSVQTTTDEDGRRSMVFTDGWGRKILDRVVVGDGTYADTYYIYDTYGNLTVVLSPEASARMACAGTWDSATSEELTGLAYLYSYDHRGRTVSKRLPGCEPVRYVYDSTDRCILWQDGNLRAQGLWRFDIADVFGRQCLSGTCAGLDYTDSSTDKVRARRGYDDIDLMPGCDLMGYHIDGVELRRAEVLAVTYYDDYSFMGQNGVADATVLGYEAREGFGQRHGNVRGQATGTVTALPVEAGSDSLTMVCSAVYYDSRDRAVQSVATNHLGGTDRSWTEYDFTGRPLRVRSEHRTPAMGADSAVVRTERRTYDRFGRELTLSHRYGDGAESREVTIRTNTYDAVGRLLTESLGDAAERTYEYDVRSRPVAITAYNYRQKLGFTYGGNVSRMTWWAYGPNETERSYAYSYDALSRLTEARYTDGEGGTGRYDVTYSYDLNGNVTALQRSGLYDNGSRKKYGLIDNLTLEYEGNMLRRVTDGCGGPYYQGAYHFVDGADEAQEYAYDSNGNTVMDLNRRVTAVGYDTNNRPRLIEFEGGSSTAYLYDAAGVKRRTVHRVATERPSVPGAEPQKPELSMTRTDYCGDIIYEDSLLSRINFDGGYLSFTNNAGERLDQPAYHFYHRDHLGNNRMDLGENGSVWQICHYYPYGMLMGCSYLGESQRWKFGGKELDRVSGLDLLDFEARPYDATLGRFWGVDPMAELFHPTSPFVYCINNPVVSIDPDGSFSFRLFKSAFKIVKRIAKTVKKTGKLTFKSIKQAGIDEITDVIDDVNTVVAPESSAKDRLKAGADLIIGTEFNNKSAKAIKKGVVGSHKTDDLIKSAKPGRKTKGHSEIYEKKGDYKTTIEDFESLDLQDVKTQETPHGNIKIGKTKDGKTVVARPWSTDGSPTLEIQHSKNKREKIRYVPKDAK